MFLIWIIINKVKENITLTIVQADMRLFVITQV